MTLERIYNIINYIVAKEWSGGAFTISRFNDILLMACYDAFNSELSKIDSGSLLPISNAVVSKTPLRPFIKTANLVNDVVSGFTPLPTDYVRWTGLSCDAIGGIRNVDIISYDTYIQNKSNVLHRADINPSGIFANGGIYVTPYDVANLILWYLRKPLTPYYDYCQNPITMLPIYMPVGSHVSFLNISTTGEDDNPGDPPMDLPTPFEYPSLYDSSNTKLVDSVYSPHVTTPTAIYHSQTVELEWDENYHVTIIRRILEKVGINLSEINITQYAMALDGSVKQN